jgi:hypothetical protein
MDVLLVHPGSTAAGKSVPVALRAKTGKDMSFVLSVERPVVAVSSAPWLDDEFWLEQEDDDVSLNSNSRDV